MRMGAFAGPVELEDLEAVAGADGLDVLDALSALLDVALVRRVESGDGVIMLAHASPEKTRPRPRWFAAGPEFCVTAATAANPLCQNMARSQARFYFWTTRIGRYRKGSVTRKANS